MSNALSGTQRVQQHAQRIAWLIAHGYLLARLPGANDDVDDAASEALDQALRDMKHVKLWGATSQPSAVRWGIRLLVSEIRGQVVSGQDPTYRR
jgi:hypothetical protein